MIAVLMAGGEGRRLRPLTETIPKPMLSVGGRPVLETLVRQLVKAGCERIFLNVRHLAAVIVQHFDDGRAVGAEVRYLREPGPYGTAGGLSLIPATLRPTEPFLVVNADILCPVDFAALWDFHVAEAATLTVVGRDHTYALPYGHPVMSGDAVVDFREKPRFTWRVNSGMYVLAPELLDEIPPGPSDMPDLIRHVCRSRHVALYPLPVPFHEIGSPESYATAETFYKEHMEGRCGA